MPHARTLRLAVRLSLREMRGGLAGFFVFVTCIALGVAAIGGVTSVADAIEAGVSGQGRVLLGGDIRYRLVQRSADAAERAYFDSLGAIAETAVMRSMARLPDGSDRALVDVKAVSGAYPLYGALLTTPRLDHAALFGERDGAFGGAAPQLLFDRLHLKPGDRIRLGDATIALRARLDTEPDQLSDGFAFAPRLMISLAALKASGLVRPGSLVSYVYKVRLAGHPGDKRVEAIAADADRRFPQAGWNVRTRMNATPALAVNIEHFTEFLTLVGLTALVVGGVGVANAVRAYLDGKRSVIATLKSLGASGGLVFAVYLVQMTMIAAVAVAIGLAVAAAMPYAAVAALSSVIPLPARAGLYPAALAVAALFGFLVMLAFALPPLGRARDVPATALFREMGFEGRGWPRLGYVLAAIAIVAVLAALAVLFAQDRHVALIFVAAAVFSFVVLRSVGWLVQFLARHAPRPRLTTLRLAIGNIHRPGALTPSVVLALGLGLALLATLALIDGNLRRQIGANLPKEAPNFFFVDIQGSQIAAVKGLLRDIAPAAKIEDVPMLRGRIMKVDGVDSKDLKPAPSGAWVLHGDRGLTYAEKQPKNATLTAGKWWPKDYSGEPLVSFSAKEAHALGLAVGDTITVNVLGRNVTAKVANLRTVQWETLGINFVMIFSPNALAGAPHAWIATLTEPDATTAEEAAIMRAVAHRFPTVTTVSVKDALDTVNRLVGELAAAIRAAAGLALVASILVLAGALAAGNRARTHDAVVLKTLGATRRTLIAAFALEYCLIGLATAVFALAAGGVAAWYVVAHIMKLPSHFLPEVAVSTVVIALVLTVGFGLIGTWRILGQKAAPVLREL